MVLLTKETPLLRMDTVVDEGRAVFLSLLLLGPDARHLGQYGPD